MRAVCAEIGADRTAIRLSPVTPANGIDEPNPQPLFDYVASQLGALGLAYIHIIEGSTGAAREVEGRPFDYARMKAAFKTTDTHSKTAWMVNNGYDADMANQAVLEGADLVAIGRPFIANPDLVARIAAGAAWQPIVRATLYGGGAAGYTDYPTL
jgi:N-ethylmaleimide reductase